MQFFYSKFLIIVISFLLFFINILIFYPILNSYDLIFPYAIHKFNIVKEYPVAWKLIKFSYYISSYISILIIVNLLIPCKKGKFFKHNKKKKTIQENQESGLCLFVGNNVSTQEKVYLPEKSLYQNILITGTIGSRQNQLCNVSLS